jgi:flagellar hook-basal body complex protein FliE
LADINNINALSTADLLQQKKDAAEAQKSGGGFAEQLKSAIEEVNGEQVKSEKAMSDIATGQVKDLHQAAIAINKAEISMKLMLEVRNKALNAYKEITRTQL